MADLSGELSDAVLVLSADNWVSGSWNDESAGAHVAALTGTPTKYEYDGDAYLPIVNQNQQITVPDNAAIAITGDFSVHTKVALNTWNSTSGDAWLFGQLGGAGQYGFQCGLRAAGQMFIRISNDGSALESIIGNETLTAAGLVAADDYWLRWDFDASASQLRCYWAYGADAKGSQTWFEVGTAVTGTFTAIHNSTYLIEWPENTSGDELNGKYYEAQLFNDLVGTEVLDLDVSDAVRPWGTWVEPASSLTATFQQVGAIDRTLINMAQSPYFVVPDSADFDFDAASDDGTWMMVYSFNSRPNNNWLWGNKNQGVGLPGMGFYYNSGSSSVIVGDDTAESVDALTASTIGEMVAFTFTLEGGVEVEAWEDGVASGSPTSVAALGDMATVNDLYIGRGPDNAQTMNVQLVGVAMWRRKLSGAEQISAATDLQAVASTSLPASELGRHGDALGKYLKDTYGYTGEVVAKLNEFNGVTSPPRDEYKKARDTAFGL